MKLSKEQEIDFLKCCIATFEKMKINNKLYYLLYNYERGFCYLLRRYLFIKKLDYDHRFGSILRTYTPNLYKFLNKNRTTREDSAWLFFVDRQGYDKRLELAKEYLKKLEKSK